MNQHKIRVYTQEHGTIDWYKPPSAIMLQQNEIHCWKASVHDFEEYDRVLWKLLSEKEKERACKFVIEKARQTYIVAHALLRFLLSKYMNVPAGIIEFSFGKNGKPFLSGQNIYFNLSHSKTEVLVVFSQTSIGCDIEDVNPGKDVRMVIKGFFNIEEQKLLSSSASDYHQFLKIWTGKEAFLKATGIGILTELNQINLASSLNVIEVNPVDGEFFESDNYYILTGYTDANSIISIASCMPPDHLKFFEMSPDLLRTESLKDVSSYNK